MNRERWVRIRKLLESALNRPQDERASYLEEACGADFELRREVDSLLSHAAGAEQLLEGQEESSSLLRRTLSHYEVVDELGRGGMGIVYRARDTRLGREVAIKALPRDFVEDPERLARFDREARVLAALNHPNIATIHGIDCVDGVHFLVMELLRGRTLAERVAQRELPLEEALVLFQQIAEALEAAHEKGIVHRDVKPANIMVTEEGRIKVLDFGLAKALVEEEERDPDEVHSFTTTLHGIVLGTASYMSPEQALGRVVDQRTDVWSFGCVLYEALSGRKAFTGETVSDTLASVLRAEPDWNALPAATPDSIRTLLKRCLQVDPHRRIHHVGDARIEIEDARRGEPEVLPHTARQWARLPWLVAAIALSFAMALLPRFLGTETQEPLRLSIAAPEGTDFVAPQPPAVSPGGERVAFVARDATGATRLWVRSLDSFSVLVLPGTEGAAYPFWSPDGQRLGFFARGKLRTIDVRGGDVREIADAQLARGGTWSMRDILLFAPTRSAALYRVSATGGPTTAVTTLGPADFSHRHPQFLPDGERFVYYCTCEGNGNPGVYLGSLDSGVPHRYLGIDSRAVFAPPGFLVFVSLDGWLVAQRFDPFEAKLLGDTVALHESPDPHGSAESAFAVSDNGVLVYARDDTRSPYLRMAWYDRHGRELGTLGSAGDFASPEISPDGSRVAFAWSDPESDAERGVWIRAVSDSASLQVAARAGSPVWSRDGSEILFSTNLAARGLHRRSILSEGDPVLVLESQAGNTFATDWTSGFVVYMRQNDRQDRNLDVWVLPLDPGAEPRRIVATDGNDASARVSPGGGWVAYSSDHGDRGSQIYIQRFPEDTGRIQISVDGGIQPRWRADGRELFFLSPGGALMAVPIELDAGPEPLHSTPELLFPTKIDRDSFTRFRNHFDVTSDGERFLVLEPTRDDAIRELHVVLNWDKALR